MASLLVAAVRAAPITLMSDADVSDLIFHTLTGGIALGSSAIHA